MRRRGLPCTTSSRRCPTRPSRSTATSRPWKTAAMPSPTSKRCSGRTPSSASGCRNTSAAWDSGPILYNLPAAAQVQEASEARTLGSSEAQGRLGALQVRAGRVPEGKARIDAAVTNTTPSAQAYEALGHLHLKEKREADAMVAFRRAATLDPDDFSAQTFFGALLLRHGAEAEVLGISNPNEAARAALARAVQLNPFAGDAFEDLSVACMRLARWEEARDAVVHATALAPGRLEYAYQLAEIDFREGNTVAGRTRLAMLVAAAPDSDVGRTAKAQLARMGDPRANGLVNREPAPPPAALPPLPSASSSHADPSLLITGRGRTTTTNPYDGFQLRQVEAGETRALGTITNIECLRDSGVRIHVTVADKPIVATASDLARVDLVTFRNDTGSISCGARPLAEKVYLTWRPVTGGAPSASASDVVGEAVAIEFLPSDYVPPAR